MEILVAMAIFATVAVLAFGAFSFAAREQARLAGSAAAEMAAAACLERIAKDLSCAYVAQPPAFSPPKPGEDPPEFRIIGANDSEGDGLGRLRFASTAHVSFEQPPLEGIARIEYYTEPAGENENVLRRSDTLFPYPPSAEASKDPILCEHLAAVAFYFYDRDGEVRRRWDSADDQTGYATPVAVRIVLEVLDGRQGQVFETTVALPVQREPAEASGASPERRRMVSR
jgi:hypothetical protein